MMEPEFANKTLNNWHPRCRQNFKRKPTLESKCILAKRQKIPASNTVPEPAAIKKQRRIMVNSKNNQAADFKRLCTTVFLSGL